LCGDEVWNNTYRDLLTHKSEDDLALFFASGHPRRSELELDDLAYELLQLMMQLLVG